MSESNDNNNPEQPRQPRNLQGLLKFAMEGKTHSAQFEELVKLKSKFPRVATKAEDTTHPSQFEQMKPEDRKFLEEALKSMTMDVVEELNKAMNTLITGNASEDEQVEALEVVTNFVADIDTANGASLGISIISLVNDSFLLDFFKIGGFCIILPCLNSKYAEVRSETALLVGELAQNNEFCQKHLLDLNILPRLIELMSDESLVSSHAFHAISCMVRSYEPGMTAFIDMGGLECLLGLIRTADREKLIIKSMFLINSFASDSTSVRDELVKMNAIERIVATLEPKDEYSTRLEQTLAALTSLIATDESIARCRTESLHLKTRLSQIITMGGDKEECQVSENSRRLSSAV